MVEMAAPPTTVYIEQANVCDDRPTGPSVNWKPSLTSSTGVGRDDSSDAGGAGWLLGHGFNNEDQQQSEIQYQVCHIVSLPLN
jgi:hypothetical protein